MAVIRCPHGHYYDDSRFSFCPHCGVTVTGTGDAGTGRKDSTLSRGGRKTKKRGILGWLDNDRTVALKPEETAPETRAGADSIPESVTYAMEPAGDGTDPDDDIRTVGLYQAETGRELVTGWLVCVSGLEKGRDYRLHQGFNRIGRSFDMDIQVADDAAVSRENHCSVVYDDRDIKFYAVPGMGTLTYYNGELLSETVSLQEGDELKLGESSFIFIPFCREGRTWDRN